MSNFNMQKIVTDMFSPITSLIYGIVSTVLIVALCSLALFILVFLVRYPIIFHLKDIDYIRNLRIKFLPYNLIRWWIVDILNIKNGDGSFKPYGFSIFCGRQGTGKTVSMIQYLFNIHRRYPKALIVTNFKCSFATHRMTSWQDFFDIRNGTDGVIFAIDEIQNEFSATAWKDFPETLLSEITQQRKQRIKIVATSQVYTRVAKQLREQCFSVFSCKTLFGRLTSWKEYDAAEYANAVEADTPQRRKIRPFSKHTFVQTDKLRQSYDTWEKVERLAGLLQQQAQ